jgi:hypothetical protein
MLKPAEKIIGTLSAAGADGAAKVVFNAEAKGDGEAGSSPVPANATTGTANINPPSTDPRTHVPNFMIVKLLGISDHADIGEIPRRRHRLFSHLAAIVANDRSDYHQCPFESGRNLKSAINSGPAEPV